MKKMAGYLMFLSVPFCAVAQFSDNFSDGDFTKNPTWSGDVEWFSVNNKHELQLNGIKDTTMAYLSTPSSLVSNTSWEFRVKLDQNPSGSNYARVYLCSDQANLTEDLSGIYVRIGATDDHISLHSQTNKRSKTLIEGTKKRLDRNPVDVAVKAILKKDGTFLLYSKLDDELDFYKEGEYLLNEFPVSKYFGVVSHFTSTRLTHQSFDDFVVKSLDDSQGNAGNNSITRDINKMDISYDASQQQYQIHYQLEKGGNQCRITIFDMTGRQIRNLCDKESLRLEGTIPWDGRSDSGASVSRGIYIICMEIYSTQGFINRLKSTVLVR